MIKGLFRLLLLNLPGCLIGGVLLYFGFTASPTALTGDGYSLKTFLFAMGGGFIALSLLITMGMLIFALLKVRRIKEIVTHGKQGTAKILELSDTGTRINDNPRVKMLLEISIPNYPAYQAEKTLTVPLINLSQVQPGSTVSVYADPEQPSNQKRIGLVLK